MLSRVAVVGPQDLVAEMIMDGTDFPELELIPLPYEKETEALDLVRANMHKVDVVVFTGPVPYLLTKGKIPPYLPLVYVRYSGAALYRVLFQILQQNQGTMNLIEHLSIDTLPASAVKETYEELGLNSSQVYVLDGALVKALETKKPVFGLRNMSTNSKTEVVSNASPIFAGSELLGAVVVFRDISDIMKLTRELKQSNKIIASLSSRLEQYQRHKFVLNDIICESENMLALKEKARKMAQSDSTVLIQGESGTGCGLGWG